MAYIYLDELKKILPEILSSWIGDDEGDLECIFNEIEQKCHVGTKYKGKKWKYKLESRVYAHSTVLTAHRNDINELTKKVNELSNEISILNDRYTMITSRVNRMDRDITATKSMAQVAKERTEVDYTQASKVKNDAEVVQEVYDRMIGRGATEEELHNFRDIIHKYDALKKEEIPVVKKDCDTCKYEHKRLIEEPCKYCNNDSYKWEAKDNG